MRKEYEAPKAELIRFSDEDVITASNETGNGDNNW